MGRCIGTGASIIPAFPMGRAVMIVVPSYETSLLERPLLTCADRTAAK